MKFTKFCLFFFFSMMFTKSLSAQGYNIRIKLANYEAKSIKLGFHYGNKQYIKDSANVDKDGFMTLKGDTPLEPGIYLVIMKPKNVYFEILINKGEQTFSLSSDTKDIPANMKFEGSKDNEIYYEYMNVMGDKREAIAKIKDDIKANPSQKALLEKEITVKEADINEYQKTFITKNYGTFSAAIIRASRDVDVPTFKGTDAEMRSQRYFWYKAHFFDNYDLSDDRLIRTPMFFNRVDYFITKLTAQIPDSINTSLDRVIDGVRLAPESFKFIVTHYLNFYAKSDIIGHDGCYVHLAKKYYEKGLTPWVAQDQLDKILENAAGLEPTLLGKTAKDFTLTMRDGKKTRLYDINSPYTIVMFWAPDCGHCKEEMPDVVKFYSEWKDKGVYLLGVCNRYQADKIPECWEFMDERPEMKFPVGVDAYLQSNTAVNYYVKSTPMVFIMDKDKKIIMKKINPKQLGEVMKEIVALDAERLKEEIEKGTKK